MKDKGDQRWFVPQLEEGHFSKLPKGQIPNKAIFGYYKPGGELAASKEEANERAVELFLACLANRIKNLQRHIARLEKLSQSIKERLAEYRKNKEKNDENP